MTEKIAVLGAGSWGSTLATVLVENGHDVKLYTNIPAQADELNEKHTNEHYMPGSSTPKSSMRQLTWKKPLMGQMLFCSLYRQKLFVWLLASLKIFWQRRMLVR